MNRETPSGAEAPSLMVAKLLDQLPALQPDKTIQLDSCSALEWIVVRTRRSVYDIIVLAGEAGDVMVRGGSLFAAFRRAKIVGSIFGDSAVKLRSICVGLHLEFWVDGKSFVTSRIQAVSRYGPQGREELHRLTA